MIDTSSAPRVLRSNQAAPFGRPRPGPSRDDRGSNEAEDPWPEGRLHLLARVAHAARRAVREVSRPADIPLPHLYRGRDFSRRRDAA